MPALVVGMGKLGGRELDYGSDLDLVVLYDGPSEAGPEAHVYFDRVVDRLYTLLTAITRTGQVFRVDLRLRQGGKATALAHALGALDRYLGEEAALWERQALVRARPILGDPALARRFMALRRARVFGPGLSEAERAEIHHVRTRMERELGREGPGRIHLKFGAGGLVDVEFLVQVLQLRHGARHGTLRTPSTRARARAARRARAPAGCHGPRAPGGPRVPSPAPSVAAPRPGAAAPTACRRRATCSRGSRGRRARTAAGRSSRATARWRSSCARSIFGSWGTGDRREA